MNLNLYPLALFASALTAIGIATITWRWRSAPGALPLFLMLVTTVLWSGANGLLMISATPQSRLFWFDVLSVGALCGTPALLAFALQYTGRERWLTLRTVSLICLVPFISVLLTWTNEVHHLFYTEINFTSPLPSGGWTATRGIGYQIYLAYSYPLVLYSLAIIVQAFLRAPRLYRGQTGAILIGTLIPFIGNIVYNVVTGGSDKGWMDPTPILFTLMGVFYAYGLFAFRLFDLVPVARHTLIERMTDGMLVIDSKNRIIDINPPATQLLGLSHLSPVGLSLNQLTVSLPESITQYQDMVNLQTEITLGDHPARHFDLQVETLFDGKKQANGRLIVFREITERKQAEQERERLISELQAKNIELIEFTDAVSHDLKSPLITIKGFLALLKEDVATGNSPKVQNDVQHMDGAMDIMQQRLDDLLELARAGHVMNKPEAIRFNDLAIEALELIHGRISQGDITINLHKNLPAIIGNRKRLVEVIQNLLDNAAKFMGDQANPIIEIGQYGEENDKPIFFVKDNGIGIPAEHLEKIFGIFNKLDPKAEGTGIGLALVKKIIEVHDGRIWVESETGQGSTFYFTLPQTK